MIVGTADLDQLALDSATMPSWPSEEVVLGGVECFQLTAEMHNQAREAVLPAGLHPTVPAALGLQAWNVTTSPWGPFSMALTRISCRSGVRARGLTTATVVSTESASDGLAAAYGFPTRRGEVHLRRHYDGVDLRVDQAGSTILEVTGLDPDPMSLEDVQYTGTMNLAHTPNGLRLVQVEAKHTASRVERLKSRLTCFEPGAWGNELLDPYFVVSSSIAVEEVVMPPVRFVCQPDQLAFTGTERVG